MVLDMYPKAHHLNVLVHPTTNPSISPSLPFHPPITPSRSLTPSPLHHLCNPKQPTISPLHPLNPFWVHMSQNLPSSILLSAIIKILFHPFLFRINKGTLFYLPSITLPLSSHAYPLHLAKLLLIFLKLTTAMRMPTSKCITLKIHILGNHMSILKDILQKGKIQSKNAK